MKDDHKQFLESQIENMKTQAKELMIQDNDFAVQLGMSTLAFAFGMERGMELATRQYESDMEFMSSLTGTQSGFKEAIEEAIQEIKERT